MGIWFIILVSLCISTLLITSIFTHFRSSTKLPPCPPSFPIITHFQWLCKSPLQIESLLHSFFAKYGPVITLPIGNRPAIFIADRSIAFKALVINGALFADRPPTLPMTKIVSSNQHNINSAPYGPLWRLLRRNLTSKILHPSRISSYTKARKWVLDILFNRLHSHSEFGNPVLFMEHFQYAMFCLLVLMCFGDRLDESKIREIENVERALILSFSPFDILNFWPKLTKILFRKRWEMLIQLRRNQEKVLIPLIEARRKVNQNRVNRAHTEEEEEFAISYVDTLLDLELSHEDNRKLTNEEIVTICSEFLVGGTDTTCTALQWTMANIVKNPEIQHKLFSEMKEVMGDGPGKEVKEEDLEKIPYLKAVVLEGLRRHPPGHFVLPHTVTEDTVLENYVIPKNGTVNFMVAEMGWNSKVWEDPMEFKPERFMKGGGGGVEFDITGSKEIKMMPFGIGRRMCPGFELAILHMEYFIGNLIWKFEWKEVKGEEVSLSEKVAFTVVMEKPLKAKINPR
ncbi:cytochrome P450 89A2 [Cucumis sativus]|uniref:Cytochrome P450 n=1 Tax=Cucumis sativus TaxID=3659 RepID=A0A0A0LRF5_CUCSA|nr:cytochrome P450 89A2 [Cucumis sativus]KGN63392.1 hypothetical protein Csa_022346 [Cucumis sativus]